MQEEGLNEPASIRDSTKKYQSENDLIQQFKDEKLEVVLDSSGYPSQECCICHNKVVDVFKVWYKNHTNKLAMPAQIQKLKTSFGKPSDGNWSRAGWTRRLGYEPPSSKKTETWRGWYGLRWKPGVIDDISSI